MFWKLLIISALLFISKNDFGQGMYYGNGQSVNIKTKSDIEGSPYYKDEWLVGSVKLISGSVLTDLALRFDIYKNELTFLKNDSVFIITDSVAEFSIKEIKNGNIVNTRFKSGFAGNGVMTNKTFYELLAEGDFCLLRYMKVYLEKDGSTGMGHYNSEDNSKRYVRRNNLLIYDIEKKAFFELPQKNREQFVLALMNKKKNEIHGFINKNRIGLKNERNILELIVYYNSLF